VEENAMRAGIGALAIVVLACGCTRKESKKASAPADNNLVCRVSFTARVRSVEFLTRTQERAIVVHFDPGFALALDVKEVSPENNTIKAGTRLVLAIHSPTLLFGSLIEINDLLRDPVGKTFDFTIDKRKDRHAAYWGGLTATKLRR